MAVIEQDGVAPLRSPVWRPQRPFAEYFGDEYSAAWAAITTAVCAAAILGSNLMFVVAALGSPPDGGVVIAWGKLILSALVVALLAGAALFFALRSSIEMAHTVYLSLALAVTVLLLAVFPLTAAWLASSGRPVSWGPVVAATLSVVAVTAFGGYYLASRRARTAIAATWLLFFLTLFSYALTLDALNATLSPGDESTTVAVRDMFDDFRAQVGLIMAFYFGTDAAVATAKILRSRPSPEHTSRMDRDLAIPRQDDVG